MTGRPAVGTTARWRSAGRVNLIGEHTDYNDGFCLPLAIEQGCTAVVTARDDDMIEMVSAQQNDPVLIARTDIAPGALTGTDGWASYLAGIVWALDSYGPVGGVRIEVDGDVPSGAGLSSSAALECSAAAALNDLFGLGLDQAGLVKVSRRSENDFVGLPNGGMDQLASVFGQRDKVLLCDMRSLDVEPVPFELGSHGLTLLVLDTKASHQLTDGKYAERRASCEEAARRLGVPALRDVAIDDLDAALARLDDDLLIRRTRHVVTEDARVLDTAARLRAGQIREIGPLLSASQVSMREDFEITVPEVDLAAEVLEANGAYGARMTGGGFGGCVIAVIDVDAADAAAAAVAQAYAEQDFAPPASFRATAQDGAHVLP